MFLANLKTERELDVWDRLSAVSDPELDEPITDMNFVEQVEIMDTDAVLVEFRLPTYWCSPNFAFLMAFGIRTEVLALPWVREVTVQLNDHCFGDEVNAGVNSGRSFHEIFAENCDGALLDDVVDKFAAKAFDRRQEVVLLAVRSLVGSVENVASMTLGALRKMQFSGEEELRQLPRYLNLLAERGLAVKDDDLAFPTWEGKAILVEEFEAHLKRLRSTRINMEFNGAMCRGLASTRYHEVEIGPDGPTLIDFMAGRVAPRPAPQAGH